jgi:hypothetical protein
MVSVEYGHVSSSSRRSRSLSQKEKIGLCICEEDKLFVWFNTAPQRHGEGRLKCAHMVTTQLLRTIAVWTFSARLRFCRTRLQTANRADQSWMSSKKKIREMVEAQADR